MNDYLDYATLTMKETFFLESHFHYGQHFSNNKLSLVPSLMPRRVKTKRRKIASLVLRPILHMFFDRLQRLGKVLRELDFLPKLLWRVCTLNRLEVQVGNLLRVVAIKNQWSFLECVNRKQSEKE